MIIKNNNNCPKVWSLPPWDRFYQGFSDRGELYSMTEPDWLIAEKHLKKDQRRIALDIGAHVGSTAIRYSENFEKVLAFEPIYFHHLIQNTRHCENIICFETALSSHCETLKMFHAKTNSGLCMIDTPHVRQTITSRNYNLSLLREVETCPLDQYELFDSCVDFIKIDTEGFVLPILIGALNTLKSNDALLQIEFNNLCPNKQECEIFLNGLGYRFIDKFDVDHFYQKES